MEYKLGEIATFSQGKQVDLKEQYSDNKGNMKRFIRIVDYTNTNEPIRFVDDYGKKYYANKDDLVMIRYGSQTAGKVVMGKSGIIANNMFKINLNNKIVSNKYMYYYLSQKNIFDYLRGAQSSSTMPAINFGILNNFIVNIPELEKQEEIVKILDSIDRKIELNRQINENLYKMMQLYFDDWIDSLKVYKKSTLSKIADYKNGLAMQKFRPENEQGLPVIKIKEMNSGISNETERCSSNIDKSVIVNDGDVLFAWSGTLCMTIWCNGKAGLNQHIFKVTSKKYPKWFYYFWTQKHLKKFIQIATGKATTMGHIKRGELDLSEVLLPNDIELDTMNKIMEPMLNKYIANKLENKSLEQLRDTLLPKLMNGEMGLENIEV